MIKTRTLFILGAGASIPYGFPSGATLRTWLCDAPNRPEIMNAASLFRLREDLVDFAAAFRASGQPSIDSFLARRDDFRNIGKLCIAVELCRCENPNEVTRPNNDDHWYSLLWEALQRDVERVEDVRLNNVKIVTFNYDRSLEYFLFEAVRNTFRVGREEALAAVESLGILHVYGSLGNFSAVTKAGGRTYDATIDFEKLTAAAEGIRVIPEARDNDPIFHKAQEHIIWCQTMCFLGFGFDFLNLARLDIPRALADRGAANGPVRIVASVLGKTAAELNAYLTKIRPTNRTWHTFANTNSMTIRESGVLL